MSTNAVVTGMQRIVVLGLSGAAMLALALLTDVSAIVPTVRAESIFDRPVRLERTVVIKHTATEAAAQLTGRIVSHINSSYSKDGCRSEVYSELFGELDRLHLYLDCTNFGTLQRVNEKLASDSKYQGLLSKAGDLYVGGTLEDKIYARLTAQ